MIITNFESSIYYILQDINVNLKDLTFVFAILN